MLLELNRPSDSLREFEATLKKEPNRFRSLYGSRGGEIDGNVQLARRYAVALLKACEHADQPGRTESAMARTIASANTARNRLRNLQ